MSRPRLRILIGAVIATVIIGTLLIINFTRSGASVLMQDPGNGFSMMGQSGLQPGGQFIYQIPAENISSTQSIILRDVSFPNGLPTGVTIIDEMISQGNSSMPINGYRLAPHASLLIMVRLVAHSAGYFSFGPTTIHAVLPFLFLSIAIENTYALYGSMCVQISDQQCKQFDQGFEQSMK